MSYIDDAATAIAGFEGSVPWMYLDTRGNVTAGIGFMLASPADACRLPFAGMSGPASVDEITADFRRVQAMSPGFAAGHYRAETSPLLYREDMLAELERRLEALDGTLRTAFPGWESFPASAKMALLDMEFNVGEGDLLRGYPRMDADIKACKWDLAAEQCRRMGIADGRNDWTKSMFMQAAAQA